MSCQGSNAVEALELLYVVRELEEATFVIDSMTEALHPPPPLVHPKPENPQP